MMRSLTYGAMGLRSKVTLAGFLLCGVAAPLKAETVHLLALGDSLTQGYGLIEQDGFVPQLRSWLADHGHDVRIVNAGVSGDTTAGGASRLGWSLSEAPDAAIVELGANDGLRGIPTQDTRQNLNAILSALAEQDIPVLFAGMLAPPNMGKEYGADFSRVFEDLSSEHDVIYYPFFLDGVAGDLSLNQPDGIHPNRAGVDVIVERILPYAERLVERAKGE